MRISRRLVPGLAISFPGRARVAVVGRPRSQMEIGLGCMPGGDVIAIAGVANAIVINNAAAYVRMSTPFGPVCLP